MMNRYLISASELNALASDEVVIFDCRFSLPDPGLGKTLYRQGHIPGAYHLDLETDLSDPEQTRAGRHPLPTLEQFSNCMSAHGVNHKTLVVAYDDCHPAGSARLWWLLDFFGHAHVRILDGGLRAWREGAYAIEQKIPALKAGNFVAHETADMVVDYSWLRRNLESREWPLIDARETARYLGREEPIDPVAGHIPGARNIPWRQMSDERGAMRPQTHDYNNYGAERKSR